MKFKPPQKSAILQLRVEQNISILHASVNCKEEDMTMSEKISEKMIGMKLPGGAKVEKVE